MKTRRLLTISERIYQLLLKGYPTSFRRQFGEEMMLMFHTACSQQIVQNGQLGLVSVWRVVLIDWVKTAPYERWIDLRTTIFPILKMARNQPLKGARIMSEYPIAETHPFTEHLAQVLEKEPVYYQLLVSPQPTNRMNDVIDSLALEGDPLHPEATLSLFQSLGIELPEAEMDRWLMRLREVTEQIYQSSEPDTGIHITNQLLRLIMSNPHLYEIIAATEPGYGLLEIVESLALEADVTGIEDMLELMYQLTRG